MHQFPILATDYDGTLAEHGHVDDATWASIERLKSTGRKILLVTGRELDELLGVCPRIDLFDLVVVENGALLYRPSDRSETALASRPSHDFIEMLRRKGVGPISVGRAIVATWEPHRWTIEETIREMGLDLRVIPNKSALMILPPGINKASGLVAALGEMGFRPEDAIAIGDAENDLAMLEACGWGVAVANALPTVKERADLVTQNARGAGVVELIGRIIEGTMTEENANGKPEK
jgi:HAD superfamily hydrolase (TIGR01484 family)